MLSLDVSVLKQTELPGRVFSTAACVVSGRFCSEARAVCTCMYMFFSTAACAASEALCAAWQCCGAEIISFCSGSAELQIRIASPSPAQDSFITLKIAFFDLTNKIKSVTFSKNLFRDHDFFNKISSSL